MPTHSTGVAEGAIKHLPSNRDILASGLQKLRTFSSQRLSLEASGRMRSAPMPSLPGHHHVQSMTSLPSSLPERVAGAGNVEGGVRRGPGRLAAGGLGVRSGSLGLGLRRTGNIHLGGAVSTPTFSLLMPHLAPGELLSEVMDDVPEEDGEGEEEDEEISGSNRRGHGSHGHGLHEFAAARGSISSGPSPFRTVQMVGAGASTSQAAQRYAAATQITLPLPPLTQPFAAAPATAPTHLPQPFLDLGTDVQPMQLQQQQSAVGMAGDHGSGSSSGSAGARVQPPHIPSFSLLQPVDEGMGSTGGSSPIGSARTPASPTSTGKGAFGSVHPSGNSLDTLSAHNASGHVAARLENFTAPGSPQLPQQGGALPLVVSTQVPPATASGLNTHKGQEANDVLSDAGAALGDGSDIEVMEHAVRGGRSRGSSYWGSSSGVPPMRRIYTDPGCLSTLLSGIGRLEEQADGGAQGTGESRVHGGGGSGDVAAAFGLGNTVRVVGRASVSGSRPPEHLVHGGHGSMDALMAAAHGGSSGSSGRVGAAGVTTFTAASTRTDTVTAWRSARAHVLPGISITRTRRSGYGSSGLLQDGGCLIGAQAASAPAFGGMMLELASEAERSFRAAYGGRLSRHSSGSSPNGTGSFIGRSAAVGSSVPAPAACAAGFVPIPGRPIGRRVTGETGSRSPSRLQSVTSAGSATFERALTGGSSDSGLAFDGTPGSLPSSFKAGNVSAVTATAGAGAVEVCRTSSSGASSSGQVKAAHAAHHAQHMHHQQGSSGSSSSSSSTSLATAPPAAPAPQLQPSSGPGAVAPVTRGTTSSTNTSGWSFVSSISGHQTSPQRPAPFTNSRLSAAATPFVPASSRSSNCDNGSAPIASFPLGDMMAHGSVESSERSSDSTLDSLSAFAAKSGTAAAPPHLSDLSFHDWEGHVALQQQQPQQQRLMGSDAAAGGSTRTAGSAHGANRAQQQARQGAGDSAGVAAGLQVENGRPGECLFEFGSSWGPHASSE